MKRRPMSCQQTQLTCGATEAQPGAVRIPFFLDPQLAVLDAIGSFDRLPAGLAHPALEATRDSRELGRPDLPPPKLA